VDDAFPVELKSPADCPRYLGRVVRGIDPTAESPVWMRERLRRAGVRPLSVAVDITNYVMLELGQPMHAFDLARLDGGIRVRRARPGESVELLNGDTVELDGETLVIADHREPVAMAGIMGGEQSAVTEETRDVMLEAAFFSPLCIAGRARSYGLHTDSSHRFERGVDPELPRVAMERATRLLVDIAGGRPGPITEAVDERELPSAASVALRPARVTRLLGVELPVDEVRGILRRLGMTVDGGADDPSWRITVPAYRFDISREVDLIEEIARVWGYDEIPTKRTPAPLAMGERPEERLPVRRLRSALVDRGYQEAISYSFVAPELQRLLDPDHKPLPLANPISADLSVMRTSLWPGLIKALLHNLNRQHDRVRLFEVGLRFRGELGSLDQRPVIAGAACGTANPEQWGEPSRRMDFFDAKGDVEALLELSGASREFRFVVETHPALHPGQSARIYRGDQAVGWLGAVHPAAQRELELSGPTFVFELDLEAVQTAVVPAFEELSRFPSIRRDLAIIVDESTTADAVKKAIRDSAGELLREVVLFDVYRGKGIPDGRKSLAMGLILQDSSRTLTDEDVEESVARVVGRLQQDLDAGLRE
jgi:phenylalanyl-tRNA synthetase beta chain